MKKVILTMLAAVGMMTAQAQDAYLAPSFGDNWSLGIDGGVATPLAKHHEFFGDMRATVGLHLQKQLSPAFALGVEGFWGINTSSWYDSYKRHTAFDNSYIGAYGSVNLFNLFGGYKCGGRLFDIELQAGAGWGHDYANEGPDQNINKDYSYFTTKAGLNFNFNVNENLTISLSPYVAWNMTGAHIDQTTAGYNINNATFNLQAGVTYHFGPGFNCVTPYNQAQIDALNGQINDLRSQLDACNANASAWQTKAEGLANELAACMSRKPEVIKEVTNNNYLNSVRFVFFRIGSSVITPDQQPNVEMIAAYLKNHKDAKVDIKGYASQDGNLDFNIKLAKNRAEAVKTALVNKYKINPDRIKAEGEGIGHMFTEDSWNRVSICTIEEAK